MGAVRFRFSAQLIHLILDLFTQALYLMLQIGTEIK